MKLVLLLCTVYLAAFACAISIFPFLTYYGSTVTIDPKQFSFKVAGASSDVLTNAFARYTQLTFWNGINVKYVPNDQGLTALAVSVASSDVTLEYGVDESYNLTVPESGPATLTARTVWGALHGLETFSQLVQYADNTGYVIMNAPITVIDEPRFKWRGFMIDTARHYLDVDTIKHIIDTMVYSKFNVLHWHAIDAESFPIQIQKYPLLSGKGAYAEDAIFTAADTADVVKYAYARGIRVVLELDTPGHAYSWGFGYPDSVANCPAYAANINNIPLDPTKTSVMQMVQDILQEVTGPFTDSYLHLGGDEVVTDCWSADSNIAAWLKQRGWNTNQLYQYYCQQTHQMALALNKTVINWQEVFDNNLGLPTATTVIHVWKDQATLGAAVKAGYRAILSAGFYLDKQMPTPTPTHYEWEDTWINFYLNEPFQGLTLTDAQQKLVLGGEAAMWGEQVDAHNYDSRVWPRACAIGERLWSPQSVTDLTGAKARLSDHACRLQRRGVRNGPIQPGYCRMPSASAKW